MRLTDIQRTPKAYILRQSRAVKAWTLGLCVFLLSFGVLPLLVAGKDALIPSVLIMALFLSVVIYLFCMTFGYRIVIDEKGIHRYSFNRVKHSLLWRYIRSYGVDVILVPHRHGQTDHLAFYASTEATPIDPENKVFIKLNPSDERAIRESGLLTFCRRQRAEADRSFI